MLVSMFHFLAAWTFVSVAATAGFAVMVRGGRIQDARESFAVLESEFGISPVAQRGTLQCACHPTDAAEPRSDRRQTCRQCGNDIITYDSTRLYEQVSSETVKAIKNHLRTTGYETAEAPGLLADLQTDHV